MTVAPKPLSKLSAYWKTQGGVPLGIVGDAAHTARPSYHNGQDVITSNGWTAANDYSVRHQRDREPHLTNAAAAIDLGKLEGTYTGLREFSRWLVERCQARAPGAGDVREIIYSPDGKSVQRYSGIDGKIHTGDGNGDVSHLWHTHISYFRDSEQRDKIGLFAPYFEEAGVPGVRWQYEDSARSGWVEIVGDNHEYLNLSTGELHPIPAGTRKRAFGIATLVGRGISGPADPRKNGYIINKEAAFVITDDVVFEADPTGASHVIEAPLYVDGKLAGNTTVKV